MLMDLPAGILLLRVIDIVMHIALQRAIAAGRIRVQPTARVDGEVSGLLHGLHGEIAGRLEDDRPLATDPGDNRWPIFVIMAPAWLALLATPTCTAAQRLLSTSFCLSLIASGVREVVGFDRPSQLPPDLIGQGRIAQPPAPAIPRADMHAQLSGNTP